MDNTDRHTRMLNSYASEKAKEKKLKVLQRNKDSVEAYGNGTTGYTVKEGSNAGKVLNHIKVDKKKKYCNHKGGDIPILPPVRHL